MSKNKDLASAKSASFRLIKFRARSEKEIRDKLKEKGYEASVINEAVEYLTRSKFLDDSLFARLWVESRIKRSIGPKRLEVELKKKGISEATIDKTLSNILKEYDEEGVIAQIIEHKLKKMSGLEPEKKKARLYGLLLRRGFPQGKIYSALQEKIRSNTVYDL